jgi:hypothetical protein
MNQSQIEKEPRTNEALNDQSLSNKKQVSQEMIDKLNAPLPPEAIAQHPTKTFLSTIKAIYVVERLNQVFGLGGWYINNCFI